MKIYPPFETAFACSGVISILLILFGLTHGEITLYRTGYLIGSSLGLTVIPSLIVGLGAKYAQRPWPLYKFILFTILLWMANLIVTGMSHS